MMMKVAILAAAGLFASTAMAVVADITWYSDGGCGTAQIMDPIQINGGCQAIAQVRSGSVRVTACNVVDCVCTVWDGPNCTGNFEQFDSLGGIQFPGVCATLNGFGTSMSGTCVGLNPSADGQE